MTRSKSRIWLGLAVVGGLSWLPGGAVAQALVRDDIGCGELREEFEKAVSLAHEFAQQIADAREPENIRRGSAAGLELQNGRAHRLLTMATARRCVMRDFFEAEVSPRHGRSGK